MRKSRKRHRERGAPDVSSYENLLAEIKKVIEKARAKGVPLFDRDDMLKCRACGAYEDVTIDGEHVIMLKNRRRTRRGTAFIVLSQRLRFPGQGRDPSRLWKKAGILPPHLHPERMARDCLTELSSPPRGRGELTEKTVRLRKLVLCPLFSVPYLGGN